MLDTEQLLLDLFLAYFFDDLKAILPAEGGLPVLSAITSRSTAGRAIASMPRRHPKFQYIFYKVYVAISNTEI